MPSQLCLEHAKRNAEKRFTGGYRHVVTTFVDSMTFQGPMAFSVAVDAFLELLHEDNHDTVYFTSARAGGAFIATGTVWSAPWQSNYAVCTQGIRRSPLKQLRPGGLLRTSYLVIRSTSPLTSWSSTLSEDETIGRRPSL